MIGHEIAPRKYHNTSCWEGENMYEGCISQLNHSLGSGYFCLGVMVGMTLRVWMRLTGELMMVYSSPSIAGAGKAGVLLRKREAFPLARRTARPWYKCLILSDSSCPVCLARADPSFLICSTCIVLLAGTPDQRSASY